MIQEYAERAMTIARGMVGRTGCDRAIDVDAIVRLANAVTLEAMLAMKPAQLRAMADSLRADVMREPIDALRSDIHTQIVALHYAANAPKRKRAVYLLAFMDAMTITKCED